MSFRVTATPLTFRTEVRPYLYLASAGLLVLGAIFVGYYVAGAEELGFVGIIAATVGVFMLYIAWVNFWVTRAGYPHLILTGHRLTVQSSAALRRDLDLSALGDTEIKILSAPRSGDRLYLCFLPAPGARHTPRRFTAPKLQPYAETILLNGLCRHQPRPRKSHPAGHRCASGRAPAAHRPAATENPNHRPPRLHRHGNGVRSPVAGADLVAAAAVGATPTTVIPAKAGTQLSLCAGGDLGPSLRRDDNL